MTLIVSYPRLTLVPIQPGENPSRGRSGSPLVLTGARNSVRSARTLFRKVDVAHEGRNDCFFCLASNTFVDFWRLWAELSDADSGHPARSRNTDVKGFEGNYTRNEGLNVFADMHCIRPRLTAARHKVFEAVSERRWPGGSVE